MELLAKVCLFGEAGVGKTSLIRRYVENIFDDKYISTIGTKVSKKKIKLGNDTVTLMIWDIMGQKDYRVLLQEAYFSSASGCIGVCDLTRKNTLEEVDNWVKSIYQVTGKVPLVLLANKCDLAERRTFEDWDLKSVAARYNAPYLYTSAKTGENVELAFKTLSESLVKYSAMLVRRPVPKTFAKKPAVQPAPARNGYIICAFCGTKNSPFEKQCIKCASPFR